MRKTAKLGVGLAAWEGGWWLFSRWERRALWKKARALADAAGGPLLVVGAPMGSYLYGDTTVDLQDPSAMCPVGAVEASIEALPFTDKQFGAVFVAHVLEHCCNPEQALAELHRVAEHVVIAYPRWWTAVAWIVPGHSWLMWPDSTAPNGWSFQRIRLDCNKRGRLGLAPAAECCPNSG